MWGLPMPSPTAQHAAAGGAEEEESGPSSKHTKSVNAARRRREGPARTTHLSQTRATTETCNTIHNTQRKEQIFLPPHCDSPHGANNRAPKAVEKGRPLLATLDVEPRLRALPAICQLVRRVGASFLSSASRRTRSGGEQLGATSQRLLERRARPAARLGRGRPRAGGEAAQVDDLVAARPVADREDHRLGEVLDDVEQLAHILGKRHRVLLREPPLGAREDRRLAPTVDLLEDRLAVREHLLRGQLLARAEDVAVAEEAPVRGEGRSLGVDVHVRDADGVRVVVVRAVKRGDGAVRPLRLHELRVRDAVEEADHAGPARRDAKLAVRRVHARGGGHGDTQVVRASVVGEGAGPQQAVRADGAKVLHAHVAPVDLHRLKVLLCRVGGRKVVLRHERARVRAGADSRRARRLVDVDGERAERRRPDVDARRAEHARGVRVSRRARVPKLLRRVGEEV
mmetsp:Transcript_41381/g.133079  ORF Transcript_41381/g.133079 Transcript_41381/m.133079 type:complete len:456 (-) Transcript_41381:1223-2590(-)